MAADGTSYTGAIELTEGPFAGWITWGAGSDPFETANGPFCFKIENGTARCAFQPRREHLNGGGAVHGGALMRFADFALFSIATAHCGTRARSHSPSARIHQRRRPRRRHRGARRSLTRNALTRFCARPRDTSFTPVAFIFRHAQENRR